MAYERQIQEHLERLNQSLARLRTMIKRGEQKAALRYMEEGELKERYEELMSNYGTDASLPVPISLEFDVEVDDDGLSVDTPNDLKLVELKLGGYH